MICLYISSNLFFRNYEGVRPEVLKRKALEGLEAMKMKCEQGLRGWKSNNLLNLETLYRSYYIPQMYKRIKKV